jgi:hypothetical protein
MALSLFRRYQSKKGDRLRLEREGAGRLVFLRSLSGISRIETEFYLLLLS